MLWNGVMEWCYGMVLWNDVVVCVGTDNESALLEVA